MCGWIDDGEMPSPLFEQWWRREEQKVVELLFYCNQGMVHG